MIAMQRWNGWLAAAALALTGFVTAPAYAGCGTCGGGEGHTHAQKEDNAHKHAECEKCENCICDTAATASGEAVVGQLAPAFSLEDAEGNQVALADFKGKTVVIHFQSCECPWDVAYQPYLNAIAAKYAGQDVMFLGINSNKNEDYARIAEYAPSAGIEYTILKDPGNKVADTYKAKTTPHMYVVDAEGMLRYMGGIEAVPTMATIGQMDEQYLEPVLDALLAGHELPHTETTSKGCSIKRVN